MNNLNSNSNSSYQYSYIGEDYGYTTMYDNKLIDCLIPYVHDVEPRIVQFLRILYYYKIMGVTVPKPCIPLYMEYQIKKEDWTTISYYIKKYNITVFNKTRL